MNNNNKPSSASNKIEWARINWRLVEKRIDSLQHRIYITSKLGQTRRMHFLQNILINSLDAKLLATRRVTTESKGRKTPGLDLKLAITPEKKEKLIRKLKIYRRAAPIRRVWIPKPGKPEKRPLGIPIIYDRAAQKLVLMALEPQWEAKFEESSYGFRPGRSTHDAIERIFLSLRNANGEGAPKFILDADLKGCFDNIDHDYLLRTLNTIPKIEKQVRSWLKAGIFEGFTLSSSQYDGVKENEIGTPQGGVISPFLANVALHGMEKFLKDWILTQKWDLPPGKRHRAYAKNKIKSITIVRYADDFVVIHSDRSVVENAKNALQGWLAQTSKLTFNETKTRIVSSYEGFNFLGFSIINVVRNGIGRLKIYPSKKKQLSIIQAIGDLCRKSRAISAFDLVSALRPKILGWANYFRFSECKGTFSKLDYLTFKILRAWVFRRDRRNNRTTIKNKYFPSGNTYKFDGRSYMDNWILNGSKKDKGGKLVTNHLPKFAWVESTKYVMVKGTNSIYDKNLNVYWALRTQKYGLFSLRQRNLLKAQEGFCPFCGGKINDNIVEVDHIIPKANGGKDEYSNLQLLHRICHTYKTAKERAKPKTGNK